MPRRLNIAVAISTPDAEEWRAALADQIPDATVTCWPDVRPPTDYLVVWKPAAEVFAVIPHARAIFNVGAGVDALLRVPTLPADVPVLRLEDAGMAEQMAEYVTIATLAAFREQRVYALQQQQERWAQRPRLVKGNFGIGILGIGVLGQAVAHALVGFGFPVYGWCRSSKTLPGIRVFAGADELPTFLAQSRVLVCLLPSTPDTRDFIDCARLAQLPRGAHFINIARGDIAVEDDLIAALDSGQLDSATLDVFRDEPLPAGHPFWHHPRITITPHVSALTLVDDAVKQIAAKVRRLERSLPVSGVVDRERGY